MKQPRDPLISKDHAAWVAAIATALGGLLAYLISVGANLDGRLDRLEQAARVLLDGSGKIIPAPESVEAYHAVKFLEREIEFLRDRVSRLENKAP